ncbi:hypothetical protein DFJ73DRAFT_819369 [Zopfochytrium polystomum]|nr:hypothetical protein DFJ73DRAFT_819369 [Zopfochytrium polystomum]
MAYSRPAPAASSSSISGPSTSGPPGPPDLELFSWGPAWSLPSLDPACLSVQAYLNLTGANWVNNACSNASISPTGELPMLRDGTRPVAGVGAIIKYLKRKGYDLDGHLNPVERAQSQSFVSLIEEKLYDALLYNYWLENENYTKTTRPAYTKGMSWVSRYYLPNQLHGRVKKRLQSYRAMLDVDARLVNEVYLIARDCFKALSAKLGDRKFFFGDLPSSLDAVAFAHLSLHAQPSLSNPRLFSMLAFEFPTLIAYCDRLKPIVFPTDPRPSPNRNASFFATIRTPSDLLSAVSSLLTSLWSSSASSTSGRRFSEVGSDNGEGDEKLSARELAIRAERRETFYRVFSAVGAVFFFVGFVVQNGIVRIEKVHEDDVGEEEEDGSWEEVVRSVEEDGSGGEVDAGDEEYEAAEMDLDDA